MSSMAGERRPVARSPPIWCAEMLPEGKLALVTGVTLPVDGGFLVL